MYSNILENWKEFRYLLIREGICCFMFKYNVMDEFYNI